MPYKSKRLCKAGGIKDEQGVLLVEKEASLKTFGTVSFLAPTHLLVIEVDSSQERNQFCS